MGAAKGFFFLLKWVAALWAPEGGLWLRLPQGPPASVMRFPAKREMRAELKDERVPKKAYKPTPRPEPPSAAARSGKKRGDPKVASLWLCVIETDLDYSLSVLMPFS